MSRQSKRRNKTRARIQMVGAPTKFKQGGASTRLPTKKRHEKD